MIEKVAHQIEEKFFGEGTGHDWYHIERVWKTAKHIAVKEGADSEITQLGALLHDIADHKFHDNADELAETSTREILSDAGYTDEIIEKVLHIVHNCSFKGGVGENKMKTLEGYIVQDADRLDAIGAIGIARTFAYGGKKGNMIYDPKVKPQEYETAEAYKNSKGHTINHFYEKLLKLKDLMNTETGKELATQRHQYLEGFLNQFYKEWNSSY